MIALVAGALLLLVRPSGEPTPAVRAEGRPAPRIAVGLPICVTNDVDHARERAARSFALYGHLPSYRAMLDREGVEGPADVAVAGDEETVAAELRRMADLGTTDLASPLFGSADERRRSFDLLASLAKEHGGD